MPRSARSWARAPPVPPPPTMTTWGACSTLHPRAGSAPAMAPRTRAPATVAARRATRRCDLGPVGVTDACPRGRQCSVAAAFDAASPARYASSRISTGWRGRTPVAAAICQRHVSESHAAVRAPRWPRTFSNSGVADGHRDVVLLPLEAVRAGDPAAVVVHVDRARRPGHEREQVERRQPDPVAAELARRVVGQRPRRARRSPCRAGPGRGGRAGTRRCPRSPLRRPAWRRRREVEHLAVLGLERVGARGRRADDPVARPGRSRRRTVEVAAGALPGAVVQAVADQRQAAADLRRRR